MIKDCNETEIKEANILIKNIPEKLNFCENRHYLFCPVCVHSRNFADRSHLRVHLENVHHIYGQLLSDFLDNAIESRSLDLEEFAAEYNKTDKNYAAGLQMNDLHKESVQ
ncbi:hypothetical protein [Candidatus Methanomassiliicoccus intestinalis]|jgi:hypothetical protein|uniref:Uncharacterized protein n=2 Tax=Candidatus Methanomassiliicoccus intestinalis TaxID=1406512 RepID=R9T433_METII|nr:hypothetical protein [Candidatus Methanomassiliicoccus intestinalis]AGN25490.1 hypothetical protein MMINT_00770 [Candidatus Methanomassiliicoccus intestinalis Issoire-Mx1]TQS82562.1 MAG: hypothetical protein A3207_08910 [Candidatus Methanomassiliicoccus intestinalis]TQS83418.1 MAG: hypothetical protein A3206_08520 [Candidatus Methanomassiliicoccus intestinalis]